MNLGLCFYKEIGKDCCFNGVGLSANKVVGFDGGFMVVVMLAAQYSECPSGKKGGDLGWFPRGKMAGPFQDVAFSTAIGATSAPFKSTHGYHIVLCEGRRGS
ncbi:Peptidyl-prolyl cis-trans isomerase NIMA-interacting 4 [Bienertia sinuspersici]